MHSNFWWDFNVHDYLFRGLTVHSPGGLVGLCLGIASMAFLFEFLRYLQALQRQKEIILRSKQLQTICVSESSTLLTDTASTSRAPEVEAPLNITLRQRALLHGSDFGLWFAAQNLAYIMMLTIMVFNGWFLVSAVLGGGLGYFMFGQRFMKLNLQNCQIIRDTFCMKKCAEPESQEGIQSCH